MSDEFSREEYSKLYDKFQAPVMDEINRIAEEKAEEKRHLEALEASNAECLKKIADNTQYIQALESRLSQVNSTVEKLRESISAETMRAKESEKSDTVLSTLALIISLAGLVVAIVSM